jgi:hypothetical protein
MKKALLKFALWMDDLKRHRKTLLLLVGIDVFMAVVSNIVDWPWISSVKWYLTPFTPICSLYPLTLAVWFSLYYLKKRIPAWFTTFIFIGIVGYGCMALIYFPVYMTVDGVQLRHIGNMIWVAVYAMQSFIIVSELKWLLTYQYVLVISYFAFKDICDRFLGTFLDILREDFPEALKWGMWFVMIAIHITVISLALLLPALKNKREAVRPEFQSVTD